MDSLFSLKGKKVIVTGGARGIGAAIVRLLANHGAQVAFTYTTNEAQAAEVLKSLPDGGHIILPLDISSEQSVETFYEALLAKWGGFDALVNNAGITKDTLMLRMKTEDFQSVVQTNLTGTFLMTRSALKPMVKARKGSIINITSVIGQTGNAGQANYAASKAGIEAFTKSVALEVSSRGIRANCVAPGFIATEMTDVLNEEQKKQILTKIPLQQIGSSDDVASAVAYLISDASRYITGHTLSVNGGMFMN